MTSIEFAFLLIAIMGIIILVILKKYLSLSKSRKNHLGRIQSLEGEMELMKKKTTTNPLEP